MRRVDEIIAEYHDSRGIAPQVSRRLNNRLASLAWERYWLGVITGLVFAVAVLRLA